MVNLGEEDTFNILLATDIHVGYGEKDPITSNDTLVSLEEIMKLAHDKDVDFVLLGGDLFHDNKPSRRSLHGAISVFRKYCLGSRPVQFEIVSDQSVNFGHCADPLVNYEDPNLNVQMPIFSIHGNHDDPTGRTNLCSLDLLHTTGLVNYFGKASSVERIEITPLLITKGRTKLALYGLGAIRDERLHRMFLHKKVSMLRPREDRDDWFNTFVLHQNRSKHSATSYIPEQFLDDFLDLVIWGHEHECRIDPEWNGEQNFYVSQPGSSVATSLSEGETRPKHVGLLKIRGKDFKITKLPLKSVRQFYLEDIILSDTAIVPGSPDTDKLVEAYCQEKVEALLERADSEKTPHQPSKPLIRLRVDRSGGFESISAVRFSQKFMDRVANPKDIILFHKKKDMQLKKIDASLDPDSLHHLKVKDVDDVVRVEEMVKEYFLAADQPHQLELLTEKGMGDAVQEYVDKDENLAIVELVNYQVDKTKKHLIQRKTDEGNIEDEVIRFKEERKLRNQADGSVQEDIEEVRRRTQQNAASRTTDAEAEFNVTVLSEDEEMESVVTAPVNYKRGKGRGRGKTTSERSRGRGKRTMPTVVTKTPAQSTTLTSLWSSPRSTRQSNKSRSQSNDSDDDDESLSFQTGSHAKTSRKRGVVYESDDDDVIYSNKRRH